MTQHAFSQLLRTISSGRSGDLLEDLVQRGGRANLRLASRIMSGLVGDRHAGRSLCFRTVQRDPGLWLDDQRAAMLDFVVQLTERPDTIVEADRQALRDAGYSPTISHRNLASRATDTVEMQTA